MLVLNHFAAPLGQAGGTRHVELFSRLRAWDYLIIASDLNPQTSERAAEAPGFVFVRVPAYSDNGVKRLLNWLVFAWRALPVGLRQPGVDVVYGSSPHLLAAAAAWAIAAVKRRPFVLEVRDLWPQVLADMGHLSTTSPTFKALTVLEMFLYSRAKAIVVLAEGSRTNLIARGIASSKIHFIPNGADPSDFVPSAPRDELRARYGFTRFTAIYAGAHGPANGLDLLLDAASDVVHLELDIVLVGGGVSKSTLMARAGREGIHNLRFLDPVPKTEIPDLLAAADIGLHVLADVELFQSAVSPNKVFDYMAAGLPVLTNCPGLVNELVVSARSGWGSTPTGLRDGLQVAVATPESELDTLGRSGQAWLAENQSRKAMSHRLGDLIGDVGSRCRLDGGPP